MVRSKNNWSGFKQFFEGESINLIGHKGRNIVLVGGRRIGWGVTFLR